MCVPHGISLGKKREQKRRERAKGMLYLWPWNFSAPFCTSLSFLTMLIGKNSVDTMKDSCASSFHEIMGNCDRKQLIRQLKWTELYINMFIVYKYVLDILQLIIIISSLLGSKQKVSWVGQKFKSSSSTYAVRKYVLYIYLISFLNKKRILFDIHFMWEYFL